MILQLATPIEFNNNTQPISISKEPPKVGSEVTVAGFGDDNVSKILTVTFILNYKDLLEFCRMNLYGT